MLPGFRFLFAATLLSMSLLVFGLGAAALLRAAHEEFASNPSWRAAPEVMFAQPAEAARPVLAMLRVDMPAGEKMPDEAAATVPAEQTAITSLPADSGRIAALTPEDSSPAETAKGDAATAETPVAENPAASETAPAPVEMPASADEIRVATIATNNEVSLRENQVVSTLPEPTGAQVAPGADIDVAATKIATLGGPPVSIEPSARSDAKPGKPDESAVRKRQQERRAAQRRRLAAARARLATQAAAPPASPFGQPAPTTRAR
jgi:hypothetical protein